MSLMSVTLTEGNVSSQSVCRENIVFSCNDFDIEKYFHTLLRLILLWKKDTCDLSFYFLISIGSALIRIPCALVFPFVFSFLIIENAS